MTKKNKRVIPIWIYVGCGFSIMISIIALIIAIAALDGYPVCNLKISYENTMSFASVIFAVIGIIITIFFITFGYNMHRYDSRLASCHDDFNRVMNDVSDEMRANFEEMRELLSSLEGTEKENQEYIRLAKGRLFCRSKYSTDDEKQDGIRALQQYGKAESIIILEKIIKENSENKSIVESAQYALKIIEQRINPSGVSEVPINLENGPWFKKIGRLIQEGKEIIKTWIDSIKVGKE